MATWTRTLMSCGSIALLGGWLAGCSLLVDFNECSADTECVAKHGPGSVCSDKNICESGRHEGGTQCQSNSECIALHGDDWFCAEDSRCQERGDLLAPPCDQSVGDIHNENAFNIGVLLPLSGAEEGFGRPLLNAIRLAQTDFNAVSGVRGRPLGLIICDTEGRDSLALDGARHLVEQANIEAIIGPDYSSQTIDVAVQVTIPNDVLLISPAATATAVSQLDDNNLVWRTAPSDAVQGRALGQLVNQALSDSDDPTNTKIAVLVRSDDTYAEGLSVSLNEHLPSAVLSGGPARFSARNYPNAAAGQGGDYTGVVSDLGAEDVEPDLVVILGSAEGWEIISLLENALDKEPIYFFADAAKNVQEANSARTELQGRVWGTAPQNVGDANYAPYLAFRLKYMQAHNQQDPNSFQFVANAFDALYLVALAAAAGGFTGPEMAIGMTRLSEGAEIRPNQSQALEAMNILGGGGSIDYQGASGPLDFDAHGDPQASPITLWCLKDGDLPEEGVILDNDLSFTALSCDVPEPCHDCADPDAGNGDAGNGDAGNGDVGNGDVGSGDAGSGDAGNGDVGADVGGDADVGL